MKDLSSLATLGVLVLLLVTTGAYLSWADSTGQSKNGSDSAARNSVTTVVQEELGSPKSDGTDWTGLVTLLAACFAGITGLLSVYFSRKSVLTATKIPLQHESARWRFDELRELKRRLQELDISVDYGQSVLAFTRSKKTREDLIKKCVEWGSVYNQADQLLRNSKIFFDAELRVEIDNLRSGRSTELGLWVKERVEKSLGAFEQGEAAADTLTPDAELLKTFIMDGLEVPKYLTHLNAIVDKQMEVLAKTMDWYAS